MQRLETEVKLLESKLSSLPQCAVDTPPTQDAIITGPPSTPDTPPPAPSAAAETASALNSTSAVDASATAPPTSVEQPEAESTIKIKDDPRFVKYFKMLAYRVPLPVVSNALTAETGFDPALLDDPDAPAPPEED
jgi:hypothetical protein